MSTLGEPGVGKFKWYCTYLWTRRSPAKIVNGLSDEFHFSISHTSVQPHLDRLPFDICSRPYSGDCPAFCLGFLAANPRVWRPHRRNTLTRQSLIAVASTSGSTLVHRGPAPGGGPPGGGGAC